MLCVFIAASANTKICIAKCEKVNEMSACQCKTLWIELAKLNCGLYKSTPTEKNPIQRSRCGRCNLNHFRMDCSLAVLECEISYDPSVSLLP